jgi:hypothetical protein
MHRRQPWRLLQGAVPPTMKKAGFPFLGTLLFLLSLRFEPFDGFNIVNLRQRF